MELRKGHEQPAVSKLGWRYHHIGIPTDAPRPGERYLEQHKMHISGFAASPYGIEWMRFDPDSPVHPLIKAVPHVAFEVDDLQAALEGKEILTEPNSPSEGVVVAMILDNGAPVELLEFQRQKVTARRELMPTPFESAQLNLQLFDLRREPALREARAWFVTEFNPESFADLVALASGERNAAFRMVLGYWDMAASLVSTGAVDGDAFRAAHGEIFATFSKIQPFLAELRSATGEPEFCRHMETVVMAAPDADAILKRRREAIRAAVQARGQQRPQAGAGAGAQR